MEKLFGCLDIGGTKILAGLVAANGEVLATEREPVASDNPEKVTRQCSRLLMTLVRRCRAALAAVGCSVPGPLNRASGIITLSPNLGWYNVPLARMLREQMGVPVALDDDARCAAIGEWWRGRGRGVSHFICVIVGTGVGGGLVINGTPVYGAADTAGEIGHMTVLADGPRCRCGKSGCLEAVASGRALAREGAVVVQAGTSATLTARTKGDPSQVTAEMVVEAARAGDPVATGIVTQAGRWLGIALANAVNLLNPNLIVLGGGLMLGAADMLLPPAQEALDEHALPTARQQVQVELGSLREYAGLIGAAWTVRQLLRMEATE
jgi:glucokinase